MGGSTYPFFRFLRITGERITHLRNRKRLAENEAYFAYCKARGLDPYEPERLSAHLKKQRGKE